MELDKAGGVLLLLGLITIPSSSFFSVLCPAELFFECVSFGLLPYGYTVFEYLLPLLPFLLLLHCSAL